MALPVLTPEQRQQALAKAAEARKKRAELKGELKSGQKSLRDVLSRSGEDTVGKMLRILKDQAPARIACCAAARGAAIRFFAAPPTATSPTPPAAPSSTACVSASIRNRSSAQPISGHTWQMSLGVEGVGTGLG